MKQTKQEALLEWLDANPGKTEEDWLLEVRCKDEQQRQDFKKFLAELEQRGERLIIPATLPLDVHKRPENYVGPAFSTTSEHNEEVKTPVEFDFSIRCHYYDLDAEAQKFYENIDPKRPYDTAREYLVWKASELGLEDTDFCYQAYEDEFFKYGFCHWKDVLKFI